MRLEPTPFLFLFLIQVTAVPVALQPNNTTHRAIIQPPFTQGNPNTEGVEDSPSLVRETVAGGLGDPEANLTSVNDDSSGTVAKATEKSVVNEVKPGRVEGEGEMKDGDVGGKERGEEEENRTNDGDGKGNYNIENEDDENVQVEKLASVAEGVTQNVSVPILKSDATGSDALNEGGLSPTLNASTDPHPSDQELGASLRGDTDPLEATSNFAPSLESSPFTEASYSNYSPSASSSTMQGVPTYSTMSWLDAFMYQHRGSMWVIFNTLFMVVWILVGGLSLYRLLGLPWCSPYVSRTQYLVIHLLIFTAATFAFVQLIHLSYGSHEGLPLFLTLLLTHTPTPCLAVSLIIMIYCIFASTRVPVFGKYLPPLLYVGILGAFIIVLSLVGDIIVGVSRNSVFLIIIRILLISLCLLCLIIYVVNYKKIISVALLMRREFRGELKSLAIPVESTEENQDAKLHLKRILLTWARITLVSVIAGVWMCIFSFCLSLFFTVSFVPLWAFWVLHSCIFVSQLVVVVSLTFGAAFTLTYCNGKNIFYKYFLPSLPSASASNGSFIKRGNFIYQRVSVVNGPTVPQIMSSVLLENDEHSPLRNSNIITELSTPPYRPKVNLRRSATFNCAPPYGFHRVAPNSSKLYPVLSDHILPYATSQIYPDSNRPGVNDVYTEAYSKPSLQISNSFKHSIPERRDYSHFNYTPSGQNMISFHGNDRFSSLSNISKSAQRRSVVSPPFQNPSESGLAGTVEALDVSNPNASVIPIESNRSFLRQIPPHHSFSSVDRRRMRQEPPEKPARKAEPILVKGVLKDNAYSGDAHSFLQSTSPDASKYSYSKDPNVYSPSPKINSFSGKSHFVPTNFSPHLTSSPINPNIPPGAPPVTKNINSNSPSSCPPPPPKPIEHPLPSPQFPLGSSITPPISSLPPPRNSPKALPKRSPEPNHDSNESNSHTVNCPSPKPIENGCADDNSEEKDCSPPNVDLNLSFDSSTLPVPKKHSLKRNHSTAGDFSTPPARKMADDGGETESEGVNPEVNGMKYPWYGTWGGRKRSKKRDSTPDVSSFNLRRLSASKTSLSSLYEKIKKPKRPKTSRPSQEPHSESNGADDEEKDSLNIDDTPEEEEEEEFLPRLDEDIDLASEILKSSTVLADFYSLKRSDLKKRKQAREGSGEEGERLEGGEEEEEEDKKSCSGNEADSQNKISFTVNHDGNT